MGNTAELEDVLRMAEQLSLVDKIRLIERLAPLIQYEVESPALQPRKSLRGLWKGIDITEEDIAEARCHPERAVHAAHQRPVFDTELIRAVNAPFVEEDEQIAESSSLERADLLAQEDVA